MSQFRGVDYFHIDSLLNEQELLVRQTARQCGTITISDHFKAWAAAGMTLGKMDQAQLLVEVGGGSGSIDFPMATITTSQ